MEGFPIFVQIAAYILFEHKQHNKPGDHTVTHQTIQSEIDKYRSELSLQKIRELVDALLNCPSISDNATRDSVISDLPDDIKNRTHRHNMGRVDVKNLVETCLNYPQGLNTLIDRLAYYEGESIAMQKVKNLIITF